MMSSNVWQWVHTVVWWRQWKAGRTCYNPRLNIGLFAIRLRFTVVYVSCKVVGAGRTATEETPVIILTTLANKISRFHTSRTFGAFKDNESAEPLSRGRRIAAKASLRVDHFFSRILPMISKTSHEIFTAPTPTIGREPQGLSQHGHRGPQLLIHTGRLTARS